MKRLVVIFVIIILVVIGLYRSCLLCDAGGLTNEISRSRFFYSKHSGISAEMTPAYRAYEKIVRCGSENEVRALLHHDSVIVRCYGVLAALQLGKELPASLENDSAHVRMIIGDFVTVVYVKDVLEIVAYDEEAWW